jgi:hypothetical protein
MSRPEQRRRPRVELGSELLVRLEGRLLRAVCSNVSMSGALLEIDLEVPLEPREALVGQRGELELVHRCGEERLAVGASFEVIRVDPLFSDPGALLLGVRFIGMDTESSIHLYELVRWQGG